MVIAIIAVLAALLLPTLGRASGRARQMSCLSNARQLALAVRLYADDHAGTLPPSADYSAPLDSAIRVWPTLLHPLVGSSGVFVCPDARGSTLVTNWSNRGNGSIGYTTAAAYDPAGREGPPEFARASQMDSPALTPIFGDTASGATSERYRGFTFDPFNGPDDPGDPRLGLPLLADRDLVRELNTLPPARLKPLYARHLANGANAGRLSLVYADGHADQRTAAALLAPSGAPRLHWRFRPGPS